MSIYQDLILDHYRNPRNFGSLPHATCLSDAVNSVCGDKIHLDIVSKKGIVSNIAFSGEGCAIFMASSSLMTDYVKGKKISQLQRLGSKDVIQWIGIPLSPNRLKCALLPLEALHKALSK